LIVVKCDQLVMVIERDDGIFRVTGDIYHLYTDTKQNIGLPNQLQ
jgi:hypothetical protein